MHAGAAAFEKGEKRLKNSSAKPSEIARRKFRVTPYPYEDTGWIIENSGPEICLLSTNVPHIEGDRNLLKRFSDSLQNPSAEKQERFYEDSFIDLMGEELEASLGSIVLPTHPCYRETVSLFFRKR